MKITFKAFSDEADTPKYRGCQVDIDNHLRNSNTTGNLLKDIALELYYQSMFHTELEPKDLSISITQNY